MNQKGLTLIELLLVVGIISLLSSVSFFHFTDARKKGEDAKMKTESSEVRKAIELYKLDNDGKVPDPGITAKMVRESGEISSTGKTYFYDAMDKLVPKYLAKIPESPSGEAYAYLANDTLTEAVFVASLNYSSSSNESSPNNCSVIKNTPAEVMEIDLCLYTPPEIDTICSNPPEAEVVEINPCIYTPPEIGVVCEEEDCFDVIDVPAYSNCSSPPDNYTCEVESDTVMNKICVTEGYTAPNGTLEKTCSKPISEAIYVCTIEPEGESVCTDEIRSSAYYTCSLPPDNYTCEIESTMSIKEECTQEGLAAPGGTLLELCSEPASYSNYVCTSDSEIEEGTPVCDGSVNTDYCQCI